MEDQRPRSDGEQSREPELASQSTSVPSRAEVIDGTENENENGQTDTPRLSNIPLEAPTDPTKSTQKEPGALISAQKSSTDGAERSPEIQNIMAQFAASSLEPNARISTQEDGEGSGEDQHARAPFERPPRTSSLETSGSEQLKSAKEGYGSAEESLPSDASHVQVEDIAYPNTASPDVDHATVQHKTRAESNPKTPITSPSLNKSLPPAPDPEPDLPFDFHRFLEQLRHRTADPVAKFLRSFLVEFGKKQWMAHEQVKIISDFLSFIAGKMQQCDVWKDVSDAEFDNAKEGMEKLVMNRLYSQTFSPAIAPPPPYSPVKGKNKTNDRSHGPGRRGQHQEDVERDGILAQKVKIYSWVKEEHLDIEPVQASGRRFLSLAQQELLKIQSYRAPRDKIICILNCCKVIFGLLRSSKKSDTSADSFIPLLIYVVLQAGPNNLVSNVQYIMRFRSQEKLGGEAGYYLSSLMGAIQFIENLDRTSLTITDNEFEQNVEAAVFAIAERSSQDSSVQKIDAQSVEDVSTQVKNPVQDQHNMMSRPTVQHSVGAADDETAAMGGLLRSFQKPLSSIGRIFTDDSQVNDDDSGSPRILEVQPNNRTSPLPRGSDEITSEQASHLHSNPSSTQAGHDSHEVLHGAVHGSTVHKDVVETLVGMFPNLDKDVIIDVVRMKDGRVGSAVDACLALNA